MRQFRTCRGGFHRWRNHRVSKLLSAPWGSRSDQTFGSTPGSRHPLCVSFCSLAARQFRSSPARCASSTTSAAGRAAPPPPSTSCATGGATATPSCSCTAAGRSSPSADTSRRPTSLTWYGGRGGCNSFWEFVQKRNLRMMHWVFWGLREALCRPHPEHTSAGLFH